MQHRALGLIPILLAASLTLAQKPSARSGIIEGIVLNSVTGEPIADARVKLAQGSMGSRSDIPPVYLRTDSQGRFRLGPVPVTHYLIAVERPGMLFAGQTGPTRTYDVGFSLSDAAYSDAVSRKPGIKVTRNTREDGTVRAMVEVQMTPAAVILGKVTMADGTPVARARVRIRVPKDGGVGDHLQTTTDDHGDFRLGRLQPGTYYVVVDHPDFLDPSFRSTYFPQSLDQASAKPLEVAAGQEARADISLKRITGVRVSGRIAGEMPSSGEAQSRRHTRLVLAPRVATSAENASVGNIISDGDTFEFREVLPGSYTLSAVTMDCPRSYCRPDEPVLEAASMRVEVGEQDVERLSMEAHPVPAISGNVIFDPGCRPASVWIIAEGLPQYGSLGNAYGAVQTDGKFTLTGMLPSRYSIRAGPNGEWSVASVRAGGREIANGIIDHPNSDHPNSAAEPLEITVTCPAARRPR